MISLADGQYNPCNHLGRGQLRKVKITSVPGWRSQRELSNGLWVRCLGLQLQDNFLTKPNHDCAFVVSDRHLVVGRCYGNYPAPFESVIECGFKKVSSSMPHSHRVILATGKDNRKLCVEAETAETFEAWRLDARFRLELPMSLLFQLG